MEGSGATRVRIARASSAYAPGAVLADQPASQPAADAVPEVARAEHVGVEGQVGLGVGPRRASLAA